MADIVENICEAVDLIIDRRLRNLNFDKTITGTIVEIDGEAVEGKENKYIVSDSSSKYAVYSDKVYQVNTSVYVSIPNGDYTQKKFIIGYSLGESAVAVSSTMKGQFVELKSQSWACEDQIGILANSESVLEKAIELKNNAPFIDEIGEEKTPIYGEYNYSILKLQADFSTNLYSVLSGEYGLRGKVRGLGRTGAYLEADIRLSSAEMFGDPYAFDGWYGQEEYFDISEFNAVTDIELYLYQNNNFYNSYNRKLESVYNGTQKPDNIFVKNISFSFGYLKSQLSKNTLFTYPNIHGVNYSSTNTDSLKKKAIQLRWITLLDGKYNVIESAEKVKELFKVDDNWDSTSTGLNLEWYKGSNDNTLSANIGNNNDEENYLQQLINTIGWKELKGEDDASLDKLFKIQLTDQIDSAEQTQSFAVALGTLDKTAANKYLEDLNLATGEGLTEEQQQIYNTYLKTGLQTVKSSETTFRNIDSTVEAKIAKTQSLILFHINKTDGVYLNYEDGILKDEGQEAVERKIYPAFNIASLKVEAGDKIIYTIPKEYTMIVADYPGETVEITVPENATIDNYALTYRIPKVFNSAKDINNVIKCQVVKEEKTYSAEKEIIFGSTGVIGTPWSIEIKLEKEYNKNGEIHNNSPVLHAIPRSLAADNKIKLVVEVWNTSTGKKYNLPEGTLPSWVNDKLREFDVTSVADNSNEFWLTRRTDTETDYKINWNGLNVLNFKFTLEGVNLEKMFAIPMKVNSNVKYLLGPTTIKYDSYGSAPTRAFNNYELVYNSETFENIEYNLIADSTDNFAPALVENRLVPKPMYVAGSNQFYQLQIKGQYKSDGSEAILFAQPIYIYQDRWSSAVLNNWNGNLTINENNGTILSAMMAAGKKNSDNTFSGVVMGDIDVSTEKGTGLWGFHNGQQSFGFRTDGTAFIGTPGGARIEFDGKNGFIQNKDFYYKEGDSNNQGLKIDFVNAEILSPAFQLTQTDGAVSTTGNIAGWEFNEEEIYSTETNEVTRVHLYSKNQPDDKKTEVQNSGERNDWRIKIGNKFGVTSDGTLFSNVLGQINPDSSVSAQLSLLSQDHTKIEEKLSRIENLSEDETDHTKTKIVTQLTDEKDSSNSLTILGRIVKLENNLGIKPGNANKDIYTRLADLEAIVSGASWEEIAYITNWTPQTDTITIPGEEGNSKTVTVITGITPITEKRNVLIKKNN